MKNFTAIHDIHNVAEPGKCFEMDEDEAQRLLDMQAIRTATDDEVKVFNAEKPAKKTKAESGKKATTEKKVEASVKTPASASSKDTKSDSDKTTGAKGTDPDALGDL